MTRLRGIDSQAAGGVRSTRVLAKSRGSRKIFHGYFSPDYDEIEKENRIRRYGFTFTTHSVIVVVIYIYIYLHSGRKNESKIVKNVIKKRWRVGITKKKKKKGLILDRNTHNSSRTIKFATNPYSPV